MKRKFSLPTGTGWAKTMAILVAFITITAPVWAASPADLLEQGIYSEKTKGDLDGAMKLYQQAVAEAKNNEAVAAEAQYRLGVCQYKKKNYAAATAAFEKLVASFPDQKEFVARANEYLAGATVLLPAPWTEGEQMQIDLKTATGFKLGFVLYSVHSGKMDGRPIWRLESRIAAGPQQVSVVEVDADTFRPLHSRWKHTLLGDADTSYSPGQAVVKLTAQGKETKTVELNRAVYDNEAVVQMIRRLPLDNEYSTTLPVFTSLGGQNTIAIKLRVTGIESVTVPAGTFECYRIMLEPVNQTFWYSKDEHRYLVKFKANAAIAELTAIEKVKPEANLEALFDFPLGEAGGGVPSIQDQNKQPPQNQAKLMILAAHKLPKLPAADNWCSALNAGDSRLPAVPADTTFAMNAQVAGHELRKLPGDTVVFFETAAAGQNRSGGAELLARKPAGVAVAFADGRALLVDPAQAKSLRWTP